MNSCVQSLLEERQAQSRISWLNLWSTTKLDPRLCPRACHSSYLASERTAERKYYQNQNPKNPRQPFDPHCPFKEPQGPSWLSGETQRSVNPGIKGSTQVVRFVPKGTGCWTQVAFQVPSYFQKQTAPKETNLLQERGALGPPRPHILILPQSLAS